MFSCRAKFESDFAVLTERKIEGKNSRWSIVRWRKNLVDVRENFVVRPNVRIQRCRCSCAKEACESVTESDGQNSVMKQQYRRRHGIDGPLKRETACPRLVSDAFQPPCNFDPESRATPTNASISKEIRAGVSNNADTNVKQTADRRAGIFYIHIYTHVALVRLSSSARFSNFG